MTRARALWLLLILLAGAQATEKKSKAAKYHGPTCLGPYCFERPITPQRVAETMGTVRRKDNHYCLRSSDGKTHLHLRAERQYYAPSGWTSELVLSDFAICPGKIRMANSTDALDWKTTEGIGLGSSEEDVIKAYGKPTRTYRPAPIDLRDFAEGYDGKTSRVRLRGARVILYYLDDPITEGRFLIRDGKVSAIKLADPGE